MIKVRESDPETYKLSSEYQVKLAEKGLHDHAFQNKYLIELHLTCDLRGKCKTSYWNFATKFCVVYVLGALTPNMRSKLQGKDEKPEGRLLADFGGRYLQYFLQYLPVVDTSVSSGLISDFLL